MFDDQTLKDRNNFLFENQMVTLIATWCTAQLDGTGLAGLS